MGTVSPVVSSLNQYVEEHNLPLYYRANFNVTAAKFFTIMTDVKFKSALNEISHSVVAADGSECGWGSDSAATLSQRILTANILKYEEGYCTRKLLKYWAQYQVRAAIADTLPFEEDFVNSFISEVTKDVDQKVWAGRAAGALAPYVAAQTDGLLQIALSDANTIKVDASAEGTTKWSQVRQTIAAIPVAELRGDCRIYCSPEFLMGFTLEMVDLNLYHYAPDAIPQEVVIPGTNVRLTAQEGLAGQLYILAGNKKNLFYGCDAENAEGQVRSWYDESADEVRFRVGLTAGVQYAFGDRIVITKVA